MKKVLLGILGLGLLAVGGFGIFRKRRPAYTEAVWVSDVDDGNEGTEKTVNEMADDVDQAIVDMDIEDELTESIDQEADDILEEGTKVLRKANEMLGDSEENRRKQEEINQKIRELEQKEKERRNAELDADIQKAIERKNIPEMYRLFERKYAYAPVGMTASEAFGCARKDGLITDEIYQEAYKRYERLWNYAGD